MSRVLPILFNGNMVRAILNNHKTVTRRLVKPTLRPDESGFQVFANMGTKERWIEKVDLEERSFDFPRYVAPPYQPGDVLYVRETWAFQCCIDCINIYEDDSCMIGKTSIIHENKDASSEGCYIYHADHPNPERIIWRPSIHMPKAAARIWLRVTDVYPQRLQEMTLDDFAKEGVSPEGTKECKCAWEFDGCRENSCTNKDAYLRNRYIVPFAALWNSTIPKGQLDIYSWAANPWVWVIEFKRCDKPEPCEMCKGYGTYDERDTE